MFVYLDNVIERNPAHGTALASLRTSNAGKVMSARDECSITFSPVANLAGVRVALLGRGLVLQYTGLLISLLYIYYASLRVVILRNLIHCPRNLIVALRVGIVLAYSSSPVFNPSTQLVSLSPADALPI